MENTLRRVIYPIILIQYFANPNTNTTGSAGLSDEMKTYYSDYLIDLASAKLVHDQFGQKHPIPKGSGKSIEFRKFSKLVKLLSPISEGVTPDGQSLSVSSLTATVNQYGGYVTISDLLELSAIDNNVVQATKLIGEQAGATLDTITREVMHGGTNVQYGDGSTLEARHQVGSSCKMTVDILKRAVRYLKTMNAPTIDGYYVCIIHPDVAYDIMSDSNWQAPHNYVDTENIYAGEIGRIAGVRFVETTEAKVITTTGLVPKDESDAAMETVTVASWTAASKKAVIDEKLTSAQATALAGRKCIIDGELSTIESATAGAAGSAFLTLKDARTEAPADGDVVYPGEAGAGGRDVYCSLLLGDGAYGVTELEGGGLQHFVKQKGSAGTADPIDQRSTVGWKATKCAERLVEEYMLRIETCSTFNRS